MGASHDEKMKGRLRRVEGQIRGVMKMMDEEKECRDLIYQLSAARSALDKTMALIVAQNLEQCVRDRIVDGEDTDDVMEEAVKLLVKSR
ncbi:metal-sensitive transcriptional regulator [Texcoconibacillus texcoconensis]|uniref:DNA-binding FrmR family transcriptional regulator n=1 Tax=Texcoconibacillus texcoconensis TaxID=1095777 RepID=A0A840QQZ7_9BACI|nr:metal-sensitive transcriptional regulator [Texcoconibacillus texcoconensis]MBB5173794.1 DNA-binding FrmR family transcriptional regulator [Texcoconibacillus texcoconensis]